MPSDPAEVVAILGREGEGGKLVAGGTDLLLQMKAALTKPRYVVDLSGVEELKRLEQLTDGGLRIGAAVSARAIEQAGLQGALRALADGAALVGSIQIRNLATVGGNLCNAAPSADMAPPLIALRAVAVLLGPGGQRAMPLESFVTGVRQTALQPGEILLRIEVPAPAANSGGCYMRHTPRREMDIAVVGVASVLSLEDGRIGDVRIALGAVAPTPLRAEAAEAALRGQRPSDDLISRAAELAVQAARPIDDQRGSAEYRRHLVRILTERTLAAALQGARGERRNGGRH
jgi:carbon-monoxide dehydrogenase medium subunit